MNKSIYEWIYSFCFKSMLFIIREHKNSMRKLRKLLSDDSKNRRSRRNVLSIQITILGWLVELAAFLTLVLGSYILGNKNNTVTMTLQSITMLFYAIFLPCSLLINSSEVKERIAESNVYLNITTMMGCKPATYFTPEEENDQLPIRRRTNILNVENNSIGQRHATPEGHSIKPLDRENSLEVIDLEVNSQ